jgi:hypothetical protein
MNEDKVFISKLLSKVSEQALELGDLSNQLEDTRQILLEETAASSGRGHEFSRPETFTETGRQGNSTSELAVQRRLDKDHNSQMVALQRQLEITESKLAEHIKNKKKLSQDLDTKARESSFYMKKCQDLQTENQQLKHQVEQTLKMTSITAKSKGFKQPLKNVDTITYYKVCDDLKECESQLQHANKAIEAGKERETQYRMRIKVLEEALDFRSEEIGLAGHSDLLAKVAKLRGEVTALKSEITNKHQKIVEAEEHSSDLTIKHEVLQRTMSQLQQRLSQSQQEMYRIQNGDVVELLKQAELERDKLLVYIQNDLQKSSALGKQVERLESELRNTRLKEQNADVTVDKLNAILETERAKLQQCEERIASLEATGKQLQNANELLQAENAALTKQFNCKNVESDELNRMQMTLFVQV